MKKTWQEKLVDKAGYPKILKLEKKFPCYNAVHKMGAEEGDAIVLVNPSHVVNIMKKIPKGKLITIMEICKILAEEYHVKGTCSLTAGIFILIAANAAEEAETEGKNLDIPYWRTLKAEGFLNEKYPGGAETQKNLLEKEGFVVKNRGKRFFVENYQKHLYQ